ncbi:MAG: hypothetical protein AAF335_02490 [Bacteroidota bacterium]
MTKSKGAYTKIQKRKQKQNFLGKNAYLLLSQPQKAAYLRTKKSIESCKKENNIVYFSSETQKKVSIKSTF